MVDPVDDFYLFADSSVTGFGLIGSRCRCLSMSFFYLSRNCSKYSVTFNFPLPFVAFERPSVDHKQHSVNRWILCPLWFCRLSYWHACLCQTSAHLLTSSSPFQSPQSNLGATVKSLNVSFSIPISGRYIIASRLLKPQHVSHISQPHFFLLSSHLTFVASLTLSLPPSYLIFGPP